MTDPRTDLKTSERFDRRSERLTDCPVCGEPIDGLAADDRTTIDPCGHSAQGLTTQTMHNDSTDEQRVLTDGSGEVSR